MRILITGINGFVGNNIARELLSNGHEIYGVDNLFNSHTNQINKEINFLECDISNELWRDKLNGIEFDAVIHLAAQSSGEVSFENPLYDLDSNVKGTMQVCIFCKDNNIEQIIFASSMSIYGEIDGEVVEHDQTLPLSLYGAGKKASEDYLRIFSESYNIKVTSLRLFNIYGNGQNLTNMKQGMASIYLAQAIGKDKSIIVRGSLDRYRDFIHVNDVVKVIIYFLFKKSDKAFGVFNIGSGKKTYVSELINKIQKVFGTNKDIEVHEGTIGDQKGIYANNSKLMKEMNLKFIPLEEGLTLWKGYLEKK